MGKETEHILFDGCLNASPHRTDKAQDILPKSFNIIKRNYYEHRVQTTKTFMSLDRGEKSRALKHTQEEHAISSGPILLTTLRSSLQQC